MKLRVLQKNTVHLNLFLAICFCLLLLASRIKMTHSLFYTFLVWNLFLAAVPYGIVYLMNHVRAIQNSKKFSLLFFLGWLLFLPNSPYIITDLIHLQKDGSHQIWFDLFLVFVFAICGLLLGLFSLLEMHRLFRKKLGKKAANLSFMVICLLCGYGVYLGRFLRFNSWDIVSKPHILFLEIIDSLLQPNVWLFSVAFGSLLWILFSLLRSFDENKNSEWRA